MKCGLKVVKYLMFFFNLLVFLSGAALLGLGIYIEVTGNGFKVLSSANLFYAVYIIIAVGGALFLIGFLGCCGAVNENKCLLGTFFAFVLILFLLEIAGAVLAVVMKNEAENEARKSMARYDSDKEVKGGWDDIQELFQCCGLNSPDDWQKMDNVTLPKSCCKTDETTCLYPIARKTGCIDRISSLFWIIIGLAFGILLIEFLAMIFACCLYTHVGSASYS